MELKLNSGDVITIPDDCKAVIKDNVITVEEEKQFLLDVLHANGKDWDADNKHILEYRWKPKCREVYYHINYSMDIQIDSFVWCGDALDEVYFSNGNCFKTREEAQKYADKFVELLKERKL